MKILLIDRALPSSVFSGKTVRLKHIYGRLAKENKIIYLRTAQPLEENESEELERWAQQTFSSCLRMPALPKASLFYKLAALLSGRPWYDLTVKRRNHLPKIVSFLKQIMKDEEVEAVITFDLEVAQYGQLLSQTLPWIQDLGDSMVLQLRRRIRQTTHSKTKLDLMIREFREARFEKEMILKAQKTIFVAQDDVQLYTRLSKEKIEVVPNGVDADYFNPESVTKLVTNNPYVVFTGHMSFAPNQDAASHFAKDIFPEVRKVYPNLEFKIVGADPSEEVRALSSIPGVEVTGSVPDIRPYLAGAAAFVSAMRMGSGIKNKVLEALAIGLPVICSPLTVAGIAHLSGDLVFSVLSPSDYAKAISKVMKDPSQRMLHKQLCRNFVKKYYSWDRAVGQYKAVLANPKDAVVTL
jgi:polysaccharide biosynthesis protein PslH